MLNKKFRKIRCLESILVLFAIFKTTNELITYFHESWIYKSQKKSCSFLRGCDSIFFCWKRHFFVYFDLNWRPWRKIKQRKCCEKNHRFRIRENMRWSVERHWIWLLLIRRIYYQILAYHFISFYSDSTKKNRF